jgi:hypothetical protein
VLLCTIGATLQAALVDLANTVCPPESSSRLSAHVLQGAPDRLAKMLAELLAALVSRKVVAGGITEAVVTVWSIMSRPDVFCLTDDIVGAGDSVVGSSGAAIARSGGDSWEASMAHGRTDRASESSDRLGSTGATGGVESQGHPRTPAERDCSGAVAGDGGRAGECSRGPTGSAPEAKADGVVEGEGVACAIGSSAGAVAQTTRAATPAAGSVPQPLLPSSDDVLPSSDDVLPTSDDVLHGSLHEPPHGTLQVPSHEPPHEPSHEPPHEPSHESPHEPLRKLPPPPLRKNFKSRKKAGKNLNRGVGLVLGS